MRLLKKATAGLLGALALLVMVVLGRTMMFRPGPGVRVPLVEIAVDAETAARRLAKGISFPTISNQEKQDDNRAAFAAYQDYLAQTYPEVHKALPVEKVGGASLVYTWKGKDPSKPPVVLMGHQDVVPVVSGTEKDWEHGPFSGDVANGYIWGRGSLDDKVMVQAILEAAEALRGAELRIPETDLPPLPEATYYRHDLVGCEVVDTTGQAIGRVTSVDGPLERSRLVIAGARGEVMVPMVEGICVRVDPAAKTIVVDPPKGLLDL